MRSQSVVHESAAGVSRAAALEDPGGMLVFLILFAVGCIVAVVATRIVIRDVDTGSGLPTVAPREAATPGLGIAIDHSGVLEITIPDSIAEKPIEVMLDDEPIWSAEGFRNRIGAIRLDPSDWVSVTGDYASYLGEAGLEIDVMTDRDTIQVARGWSDSCDLSQPALHSAGPSIV